MKTAKIVVSIVIIAAAAGFFIYNSQKPGDVKDMQNSPEQKETPKLPGLPPLPAPPDQPQGILLISDDQFQGNLMLQLDDIWLTSQNSKLKVTYIRTSRDYSALIGKHVKAIFKSGDGPFDFVLEDIIPTE